jgi:hypothetical protein
MHQAQYILYLCVCVYYCSTYYKADVRRSRALLSDRSFSRGVWGFRGFVTHNIWDSAGVRAFLRVRARSGVDYVDEFGSRVWNVSGKGNAMCILAGILLVDVNSTVDTLIDS